MSSEVEFTDEFERWWDGLTLPEQKSVGWSVEVLAKKGPTLGYPHTSKVEGSAFGQMRELRVQHQGQPYRVFFAFDPRRVAILLIGGCKVGDDRFYERMIPIADRIFEQHLLEIRQPT